MEIPPEQIEELTEDVATVADEILAEVKECRAQQAMVMADLVSLRENGAQNSERVLELQTELRNLREENRNLNSELRTLLDRQPSPSLTPSTSQPTPEAEMVTVGPPINPENVEAANPEGTIEVKKRKRYRI